MKKLSIIVPVYNAEQYLRECVDSLLFDIRGDVEIILVDDASTDNSRLILAEYIDHPNVKVIFNDHQGVSVTRNKGISVATGEYITFIDSDDYVGEDFYNIIYNSFAQKSELIIFKSWNRFSDHTGEFLQKSSLSIAGKRSVCEIFDTLFNQEINSVCMKIFERSIIVNNHILFDASLRISEDFSFVLEYLKYCESVYVDEYIPYYYRMNPNGTAIAKPGYIESLSRAYINAVQFAETYSVPETTKFILRARFLQQLFEIVSNLLIQHEYYSGEFKQLKKTQMWQELNLHSQMEMRRKIQLFLLKNNMWPIIKFIKRQSITQRDRK